MLAKSRLLRTPRPHRLAAAIAVAGCASLLTFGTARPAAPDTPVTKSQPADSSDGAVIARIGNERVTEADVVGRAQDDFDKLQANYQIKLRQLELKQTQDRYSLLKQQTERLLDQRALALEAKARRKSEQDLLADIKVAAVTEPEAKAFYEANKERTKQSFEDLKPQITQYLANQHNTDATRRFYDGLRAKHHIESLIQPYRLAVDATGPTRGNEQAPITVVEFADFECPYCRQAEDTLQLIMAKHPNDVRLFFRQLPLASIHPNALIAARAAVCADRQGKFWPMHDAMYSDQKALSEPALKDTAKRLGLDTDVFSACLTDEATTKSIFADIKAADELNITGTPFFLVNGRPINGNVPADQFESMVLEELHRNAPDKRT